MVASAFDLSPESYSVRPETETFFCVPSGSADNYTPMGVIPTMQGSKTMTLDRKTQRLFVPARENQALALWVFQHWSSCGSNKLLGTALVR